MISDTLVPKLKEQLKAKCVIDEDINENSEDNMEVTLAGIRHIKRCYVIDQRPIGRSRTSCPATYTGIFDRVRNLFAESKEANKRGYSAGMFWVNSKGGCRKCKGDGVIHYHVGFGNFIDIDCDECGGTGYIAEAMEITIDGKNNKGALYILDEPTTGLSFSDTEQLLNLLNELVDAGNSIIITEHDPYVLSNCDYILEMGEGGGTAGGNVIATGTPKELKNNPNSIIGRYLK